MRRFYRFLNRTGLVALICLISYAGAAAAISASSIDELTLAYLYNFLKFTEWPVADTINEMTICVSKSGRLAANLEALAGHLAQNKKVIIRPLETSKDPHTCQLLFLDQNENSNNISQWLKQAANQPILICFISAWGLRFMGWHISLSTMFLSISGYRFSEILRIYTSGLSGGRTKCTTSTWARKTANVSGCCWCHLNT